MKNPIQYIITVAWVAFLSSCAIPNDIPYPIVEGNITAFETEGVCDETGLSTGNAKIDKTEREVTLYVNDTVDIRKLRVTRFEVSNDAVIVPDVEHCLYPEKFPTSGFNTSGVGSNTQVDFSNGTAKFTLQTYQDYEWEIHVLQIINREVEVEGQVGNAVIDPESRVVVVYVSPTTNRSKLKVKKFTLGGPHGKVVPDPTAQSTYDFSSSQSFNVQNAWSEISYKWSVHVYVSTEEMTTSANAFARSVSATISGTMQNGTTPIVEYKKQGESNWETLKSSAVKTQSSNYTAELSDLIPGTTYVYRVSANGSTTSEQSFDTAPATPLENGDFDNWHIEGKKLYNPWMEGSESFWDTGNRGATTVGDSNSTPTTDTSKGSGYAANLLSKWIVIKFAAGNIFTGSYLKTDGTNGILSFGRPFTSFPTKLQFDYKYHSSIINRPTKDFSEAWEDAYGKYINKEMFLNMKGQPDSCQVYIALTDWEGEVYNGETYPYIIRTRPSELHLIDLHDDHIIAYAQMTKGEDVVQWTTQTLTLNYRHTDRTPKWILVVASSSKYGDYFVGGEGSLLNIDNMKLLYE